VQQKKQKPTTIDSTKVIILKTS